MVWCPIHNCYVKGKKDKAFHIEKFGCNYIENYKSVPAMPFRKARGNKSDILMTIYLAKRSRRHRSVYRTEQMRKR